MAGKCLPDPLRTEVQDRNRPANYRRLDFQPVNQFEEFKSRFVPALGELCGPRRFCLHWILSENKAFCSDGELIYARMQMKALNSRLHSGYMQRLA